MRHTERIIKRFIMQITFFYSFLLLILILFPTLRRTHNVCTLFMNSCLGILFANARICVHVKPAIVSLCITSFA